MGKIALRRAVMTSTAGLIGMTASAAGADQLACETVERYELDNGIEVVLQADRSLPLVAVVSSVHAGSRNDPPGYAGLAHYTEHLLFREGGPFPSVMTLYDGSGATINATTSPDTTDYFALLPSEQLERALWIEARRLALGLDVVEEPSANAEREVVLREHSERGGAYKPLQALRQAEREATYPANHPYRSLLSTVETIEAQSLATARWFFAEHYRLDKVRLIVAGDFEAAPTRQLIERHFAGLTDRPRPTTASAPADPRSADDCSWAQQPTVLSKKRIALYTRSRNERVTIKWPIPPGLDPEVLRPAVGLLASKVSDRAKEQDISHRVWPEVESLELAKSYVLNIDIMPGQEFARAEPLVWEAVAELGSNVNRSHEQKGARRQAELIQRLTKPSLLDRARKLTQRSCLELQCAPPTGEITPEHIAVFAQANALVVESRYGRNAPREGSVEVSP